MKFPTFKNELECIEEGFLPVGCDEVGRGPLAGPVVACACVLDHENITEGGWHSRIRDSKTIREEEREILYEKILENALAYGIGEVWQEEIDKINIHNATLLAMRRAVEALMEKNKLAGKVFILIDGKFEIPNIEHEQRAIIDGDADVLSIAAASIVAKVHRDRIMKKLSEEFPEYGLEKHKGYGTKEHMKAINKFGVSPIHRKTFVHI